MAYPQIVDYNEAVQNPAHVFTDPILKNGSVTANALGLPLVLSGGFALTYSVITHQGTFAVRCFHRQIPDIEQKYTLIARKLRSLSSDYFVSFDFQRGGIVIRRQPFPIVKMDWVVGDTLGVWLDKNFSNPAALKRARDGFIALASFLERSQIAHGDIQNGNVMMANGAIRLIDYDGMFVDGLPPGRGTECGHKHFQHPRRTAAEYGRSMDRFSFVVLDLSLQAVIEDCSLYRRFREGGETILFKANDFVDPQNSEVFALLLAKANLREHARNFRAVCEASVSVTPTLADFLAGRNIPAAPPRVAPTPAPSTPAPVIGYIGAFPVIDALDYATGESRVGDRVELIGRIVEVKRGVGRHGRGRGRPYVFINFGPWQGNIIKINIWSDGLATLQEQPTAAWVGRWISVTGLLEPPYNSAKYHYSHLSVTVQNDGEIQQLSEAQAAFRLRCVTPTHGGVLESIKRGLAPKTRNQQVVDRMRQRVGSAPPGGGYSTQSTHTSSAGTGYSTRSAPKPAATPHATGIPSWVWWLLGLIALLFLLSRQ
jgi:hypothetical protein